MEQSSVTAVFSALNQAQVRYLVVGGLAVLAHGYVRATQDIDIVLELNQANAEKAIDALEKLGYRPALPVAAADFALAKRGAALESRIPL